MLIHRHLLIFFRYRPAVMDPIGHFADLNLRVGVVKRPLSNLEARIDLMIIELRDDAITFNLEVWVVI